MVTWDGPNDEPFWAVLHAFGGITILWRPSHIPEFANAPTFIPKGGRLATEEDFEFINAAANREKEKSK